MQPGTDRIRTTHVGSLARPAALLNLMKAAAHGQPADPQSSDWPRTSSAQLRRRASGAWSGVLAGLPDSP